MENVRVRFAPSPTGHLHVGGARTAIFNWLFAKRHGGKFIIRVEDTDQARSTRESEQMVLDDLRWLGLMWDEGPDVGGPDAPYRQSERMGHYAAVATRLLDSGHAYRCFCAEEELEAKRKLAEEQGRPPHYDLTCFRLTRDDIDRKVAEKVPFVIRFHVPKEDGAPFDGDVTIDDLIRGEVTWKKESLGDFIILRSDEMPTYNFSVVVDDHEMEITHVIRAEEHLTNTHRQVLIYRALGWDVPQFAHVSLILGPDRTKLSKRHGATSVSAYAEQGYLADAMVNYLTLLGWSPPDGNEVFSRDYAIQHFSLNRVNSAPAVFDAQKLDWLNGQYIHAMETSELRPMLIGRFHEAGWIPKLSPEVERWLDDAIELVKKSSTKLTDFTPQLRFVFAFSDEELKSDAAAQEALADPSAAAVLDALERDLRANGSPADPDAYHAMADRVKSASGAKGKKLFMPMRLALTGSAHGPELARSLPLIANGTSVDGLAPIVPLPERVARARAALAKTV